MFDPIAYLAKRPDLRNNWNADYEAQYGSIENYALADAAAWGDDQEKADIAAGSIKVPDGFQVTGTGTPADSTSIGTTLDPNGTPYEQELFKRIIDNYVNPDLAADAKRRKDAEGIVTDVNRSLDNAITVNNEVFGGVPNWNAYLQENPDIAAWAQSEVAAGRYPNVAAAAAKHYEAYGKAEGRKLPTQTRLDAENQNANAATAAMRASAAEAAATRLAALDQRKSELTAAIAAQQSDRTGALDAQTAQLRTALAQLETERTAALQGLNDARLAAAEGRVTGINQGLQSERDRIAAEQAAKGYVGGSAAQDAAMTRATIGARGAAAQAIGDAKVANATDSRSLGDEIAGARFSISGNDATERRGISDQASTGRFNLASELSTAKVGNASTLATDTQNATNLGAKMKSDYFDNDFSRRLQAALLPATVGTNKLQLLDAASTAGNSGLKRTLDALNWFGTSSTPPTTTPTNTVASTVGNSIGALGAGVASAGMNLASTAWNRNDWLKSFNPNPPTT